MNAIIDQLKQSPVAFIEALGWWPEPGYMPEWQKRYLAQLESAVPSHSQQGGDNDHHTQSR